MNDRQKIIDEHRRRKPLEELERKWLKAKGRHSKQFWCVEWLDLAYAKADLWYNVFKDFKDG